MYNILVCDDDKEIVEAIEIYLTREGYNVLKAYNGREALKIVKENENIHLIILDIMMPELDGISVANLIRKDKAIPIIMLSAKSEDYDKISGLNNGADDYITKPYNPTILLLRIANIFKRMENNTSTSYYDDVKVYQNKGLLVKDDKELDLTKNEMIIFSCLLSNRGNIVTRDELMTELWNNEEYVNENALTVNISRLRAKLEEFGIENAIETRKGQGYKLL